MDFRRPIASGWRILPRFSSATSGSVIASLPRAINRGFVVTSGRGPRFDRMGRWSGLFQVGLLPPQDMTRQVDHPYYLAIRSKVCSGLSFCLASVVGCWDWDHFWDRRFTPWPNWFRRDDPRAFLGRIRTWILTNEVSTWFRLRDGWLIWDDAGRELEWQAWRRALVVAGGTKSE
jgi:hypothetical protein